MQKREGTEDSSRHEACDPVGNGPLDELRRISACGMGFSVNQVSLIGVVRNV
jgi:hypothetical protein